MLVRWFGKHFLLPQWKQQCCIILLWKLWFNCFQDSLVNIKFKKSVYLKQKNTIKTNLSGHLTITPTGTLMSLHSKYIDINMELFNGVEDRALCGSVEFFQTKLMSLWTLLCALWKSCWEIEKGLPPTVATTLEA